MRRAARVCAVATVLLIATAAQAGAQAWVLPQRMGAVTFVGQTIDHVGRMRDDGTRAAVGKALNHAVDVEFDYAWTDRLSFSAGLPFVFSKYTDHGPRPEFLPFPAVDACYCWQRAFADLNAVARYNLINVDRRFMLTPFVSVGVPSHAYDYVGEAVVGRRLKELRIGADAGQRLDRLVSGLAVQASYSYTIVPRVLEVPNNRSNGGVQASLAFARGISVRGLLSWQRTHGGWRMPADVNVPEHPERLTEFHRMLRDNYLHTGAGVSYSIGEWDLSGSFSLTARGSNSHDARVYSFTLGRMFEIATR